MKIPSVTHAAPQLTMLSSRVIRRDASALAVAGFAVVAVLSFVFFLFLGRDLIFWHDEWKFIDTRIEWNLDSFLRPHNEHFVAAPALVYKVLLEAFGLHSYLPYLAVLLSLHIVTAAALFRMIQQVAGAALALAGSVLFLFLGTGAENLLFALQISFIGATAAGAWALALFLEARQADQAKLIACAILLVIAVASTGAGLFFVASVGAVLVVSRARWREAWLLLPALATYGAWYVAFGRGSHPGAALPGALSVEWLGPLQRPHMPLVDYVVNGLASATGSVLGLGREVGLVLAVMLLVATAVHVAGNAPLRAMVVAGAAGVISQFVITGLGRAFLGPAQAEMSRYVYVAAVFLAITVAALVGPQLRPNLRSPRVATVVAAVLAWALVSNILAVRGVHQFLTQRSTEVRATVYLSQLYGGSPAIPDDRTSAAEWLRNVPGPARLRVLDDHYGLWPRADETSAPQGVLDYVLFTLVAPSLEFTPRDGMPSQPAPLLMLSFSNIETRDRDGCLLLEPRGPDPYVSVRAPGGDELFFGADYGGRAQLFLSRSGGYREDASTRFEMTPGVVTAVEVPDLGDGSSWFVRFDPPAGADVEICAAGDRPLP